MAIALAMTAAPALAQSLYWVDTNYGAPKVVRADPDGNSITTSLQAAGTLPEGLGIDAAGNVYWGEAAWASAAIKRAALDLTGGSSIVTGGSVIRGVAVDPVAQRVYWTTSNLSTGATIRRSALNGTGVTTLVTLSPLANPRGISVDHVGGKLYWADYNLQAIYRSNLDGSLAGIWLETAGSPYGVVVDPADQKVYWTESGNGQVLRANTDGTGVTTLVSGGAFPTYITLDVAGDRMYWSEGGAGSQRIRRATTTGAAMVTLPAPLTTYGGLVYSTYGLVPVAEASLPTEVALDRVWPSPGRGPIHVAFSLPRASRVRLEVFDLQGRAVAMLAEGELPAGRHERLWSERTPRGAGMYFVRLTVDGRTWRRRVVLAP